MVNENILIISSEFPPGPGGIGQHAFDLARSLQTSGKQVTVMSPGDYAREDEIRSFDAAQPFSIIRYPRIGVRTYTHRISITLRFLSSQPIQAVFLTGKFSLWTGWFIKKRFPSIKTICILHGSEVNLEKRTLRKFTHRAIKSCNEIVSVSEFTRSLLPAFIKNKRHIHIIPNGINPELLKIGPLHQPIELKGHPKMITVGHVSPRKGQHRVIEALPELIKHFPNIHYHIVGRPVMVKEFSQLAESLGVLSYITFHGKVASHEDLQSYYKQADVFMLLSENQTNGDVEGFGIVALEANYYGVPVIGAKYCGVEDAVSDGLSGYLVDGDNPEEIGSAVLKCIQNKSFLTESSKKWSWQHDWHNIMPEYLKLCN